MTLTSLSADADGPHDTSSHPVDHIELPIELDECEHASNNKLWSIFKAYYYTY